MYDIPNASHLPEIKRVFLGNRHDERKAVIDWAEDNNAMPRVVTWGWGVGVIIKNYVHDSFKKLVMHQSVKAAFMANDISYHTLLLRGAYDDAVMGLVVYYLDRPMGVDASVFRAVASLKSAGPGNATELALCGEIDTLRAQLENLEATLNRRQSSGMEQRRRCTRGIQLPLAYLSPAGSRGFRVPPRYYVG